MPTVGSGGGNFEWNELAGGMHRLAALGVAGYAIYLLGGSHAIVGYLLGVLIVFAIYIHGRQGKGEG